MKRARLGTSAVAIFALLASINIQTPAQALLLTATGTDAAICNQDVSNTSNVSALRIAGGDCVITFQSGVTQWVAPANLRSIRVLLVGGGGGGGGSYDTTGSGGGGGGQALLLSSRRILASSTYTINVGSGGAAGFHIAQTNSLDAIGRGGASTTLTLNGSILHTAFGGGGGSSSRANATGASTRVGGAAATLSTGGAGGGTAGGGFSGGGGGGSAGAGANGNNTDPGRDFASAGGAGTSIDISGAPISYGVGGDGGYQNGATTIDGVAGSANTGNGGGGASVAGSAFRNGGAGGSGVVIMRYRPAPPTITELSIAGSVKSAVFRAQNTISAKVDSPAAVTFYEAGRRIPGCVAILTTGTSPNNIATCNWKPTVKGARVISADAAPVAPGITGQSTIYLSVGVSARSSNR